MNRGYSGFYKGFFLRSSYEYAFAKSLDFRNIRWKYEVEKYDLGYKVYKPDFFIYDKEGKLIKIIEIKSREKKAQDTAKKALKEVESKFGISGELVSYEELLEIYQDLPFTLNSTLTEWINSSETSINKTLSGKLNGHYNFVHSVDTKQKIGAHTKKLWESNGQSKSRMLEGLRKSGLAQKGKIKVARMTRICPACKIRFEVLITSRRKYCSQTCCGKVNILVATSKQMLNREIRYRLIKAHIDNWSKANKDAVLGAKYNKIKTILSPLLDEIYSNYHIKDFRVISAAVFDEDLGRKALLAYMKEIARKV